MLIQAIKLLSLHTFCTEKCFYEIMGKIWVVFTFHPQASCCDRRMLMAVLLWTYVFLWFCWCVSFCQLDEFISPGNTMSRLHLLNKFVFAFSRSGRLRQVTTSELSSDRCLPRLFLCRVPLLLWKCQRKGKWSPSLYSCHWGFASLLGNMDAVFCCFCNLYYLDILILYLLHVRQFLLNPVYIAMHVGVVRKISFLCH